MASKICQVRTRTSGILQQHGPSHSLPQKYNANVAVSSNRHWYEKDKLIPVNPAKIPILDEEKLAGYPSGYRYLAYLQEATMGVKVLLDMPGHRRENESINGQKHNELYMQCKAWVEDQPIHL